jgi:hypothetical protein
LSTRQVVDLNSYANSGEVKPAAIFSRDTASNPARLRRNQTKNRT